MSVLQNDMDEQYGERYAQKVEDRLLHYLHELDAVLQGDTYIDKVCVCAGFKDAFVKMRV